MTVVAVQEDCPLTPAELMTLAECEAAIERGLRAYIEAGQACARIRDGRLYRASHSNFETYCRERWDFVASRARQLIAAAQVAETVTNVTLPAPRSEGVARELMTLRGNPAELEAAWSIAVVNHGDSPTAAQVREVIRGEPPPMTSPAPAEPVDAKRIAAARQLVSGVAERARHIASLSADVDPEAIRAMPEEDRQRWAQQLSTAQAVLKQVGGALS